MYQGADGERLETVTEIVKLEKVILFGSQAEGGAGLESDIDLCIVADAHGGAMQLQAEIREKLYRAGIAARGIVLYG
jgi:predicted nucleotidyltransferase